MNKFIAIFSVIVNLAMVCYVGWQMSNLSRTTQDLKRVSIKLPPEFEAKFEGNLSSIVAEVKASADGSIAAIESATKSTLAGIEQNSAMVEQATSNTVASIAPSVQSTFSEVRSNLVALLPEFEAKLEGNLSSIIAEVKASADGSIAAIESATKSTLAGIEQNSAMVEQVASNTVASIAPSVQSTFSEVRSNLEEMCRSKVLGNEVEAERAYQMANQALKNGDIALAKIYCLNAISHSPTRKLYFEKLLEIGGNAREDLEQVKGLLELGIYQVAADEVPDMQRLLAGIIRQLSDLDASEETEQMDEQKTSIEQAFAQLRTGDLSHSVVIGAGDAERINLLQQRLAVLNELNQLGLTPKESDEIVNEENWTRGTLAYFSLSESVSVCLLRAEKLLEEKSSKLPVVNALIQAANQSLAQAFLLEKHHLPKEAEESLLALGKRIEMIEIKFNKIKSLPAIEEIRSKISFLAKIEVKAPYQSKIASIGEGLTQISLKMTEVFDADERTRLGQEITTISSKLASLQQAQYKAYQVWAIDQCKAAFDAYNAPTFVSGDEASRMIENHLLGIDSTLLTPDVARLYQDVLGKLLSEMGGKLTAKTEIELARQPKKQLSDF